MEMWFLLLVAAVATAANIDCKFTFNYRYSNIRTFIEHRQTCDSESMGQWFNSVMGPFPLDCIHSLNKENREVVLRWSTLIFQTSSSPAFLRQSST
jgi:hypothetical protein